LKEASFVNIDNGNINNKKLYKEDNSKTLFDESNYRLKNILDTNKTIGLDELMNLLKN